jgi:UDP-N-acetylglucosamine:LPS N-acetylglucosamine transferase
VSAAEQRQARVLFDLPAAAPLALVVAGSGGVGDVQRAVRDIVKCGVAEPVVVCGHNESLRRRLRRAGVAIALGWVDEMAMLMRACDVVVQNAGGLSSLEALASGVPMVTYRCVPGHGRTNADALEQAGWAAWIRDRTQLLTGLKRALAGEAVAPGGFSDVDPARVVAAFAETRGDT